jgi:tetratricopeptide (TPR) repeat protein
MDATEIANLLNEAREAYAKGDWGTAADRYRRLLHETKVCNDEAFHVLSVIAYRAGKTELSLQLADAALGINPRLTDALINKAVLLRVLGKKEEARATAQQAVLCDPKSAGAWHTASFFDLEDRAYAKALEGAREAVKIDPSHALAHITCANSLMMLGPIEESYRHAAQALALEPNEALMHLTMGQVLRAAGYPLRALPHLRRASELRPNYTDAKMAEASSLFVTDQWEESWRVWESRPFDEPRFHHLPRWNGDKTASLVVHAEQGMGDAFQFLRFVPLLKERADIIYLQVPKPLLALTKLLYPDLPLLTPADPLPQVEAHAPIMSLPFVLKLAEKDLPTPVLFPLPEDIKCRARDYLKELGSPRVGLVWAGNPMHLNDFNRSISFGDLGPLLHEFPSLFLSLQDGKPRLFDTAGNLKEVPPFEAGDSLLASAAILSQLDLLLTIDSMPAHLAGCLEKPVWMMLPFDPDGRWLFGREDSVWYPSFRLFRQKKPRDWAGVLAEVSSALKSFLAGDLSVLSPRPFQGAVATQNPYAVKLPL